VAGAQVAGEEEGEASAAPSSSGRARGGGDRRADGSRRARLAAAVGVSQMVLPFWSGATWDKQHGVDVERRRWAHGGVGKRGGRGGRGVFAQSGP
jgi:hypothetical protein